MCIVHNGFLMVAGVGHMFRGVSIHEMSSEDNPLINL